MPPKHSMPPMAAIANALVIGASLYGASLHPAVQRLLEQPVSVTLARAEAVARNVTGTLAAGGAPAEALVDSAFTYVFGTDSNPCAVYHNTAQVRFCELNEWKNSLILPAFVREALPHGLAIWVRNYVAIHLVYFGIGSLWAAWIYWAAVDSYFPRGADGVRRGMPTWAMIRKQMWVSWTAMPLYVMMPTLSEWSAEKGWTRAYHDIADVGGLLPYLALSAAYLLFVEWAIYWIHRLLHTVRFLFEWLHDDHHLYNKQEELTPFAGLAFHPLDGCAQAAPYLIGLYLMPVHYWTHLGLLFFTGVWTTNIHDTVRGNWEPVMGAKYHTYHHTKYRDNYGQFFVLWDWIHGTLYEPSDAEYGIVDEAAKAEAEADALRAPAKAKAA